MEIAVLLFLSSGLFLGWSLGANDAANVFGTAVGSRMIRFGTAALICGVFVVLGAVFGGAGAAHGLGKLGAVNALPGAFMVALSAALTVYWMTKAGLPVSTTQAIVGAIIGWNLFSGSITDTATVARISATWVACPILGAVFAAVIYVAIAKLAVIGKLHMLRLDLYTRAGLVLAGAFGSYSLGANNIGNVMGVFVESSPFSDIDLGGVYTLTSVQQLFLLGALAIAVGVFTYSKRVMMTVGNSVMPLNPVAAWAVVLAHSLVLFLFSSTELEHALVRAGWPAIPLIPVSSSQAVIGGVIGIGLLKGIRGVRQIRWGVLGNVASGWVTTPIISALVCFVMLFVLQNVFKQQVYQEVHYVLSPPVMARLQEQGAPVANLAQDADTDTVGGRAFRRLIREHGAFDDAQEALALEVAEVYETHITPRGLKELDRSRLTKEQAAALEPLSGQRYNHRWQLYEALTAQGDAWKKRPAGTIHKVYNARLGEALGYIYRHFRAGE